MSDGKIIFDTTIDQSGLEKGMNKAEKSAKSRAARLAAEYRKQGMSMSDAMKRAWAEIERDSKESANNMKRHIGAVKGEFGGLSSAVKRIGGALIAAFSVAKIISFGKSCIELGSDLAEVENVVSVTFGDMTEDVDRFAKAAAKTAGLSEIMAKQYMGTFGAMSKSFGFTTEQAFKMSAQLTKLAGDVASFYNISQDEAYTKLKSVYTGETESLKELGVVMTQSALDQFALANGYKATTKSMSEQEKVALRLHFVTDKLSGASGDFERTSSGWANQVRILALNLETLKSTIGQGLITALTPALQMLNRFIERLQYLAIAFRQIAEELFGKQEEGGMAGLSGNMSEAAGGAEDLAGGIGAVGSAAKKAKRELSGFDELTKIGGPDASSGGAGGGIGGGAGGLFDFKDVKVPPLDGTVLDPEKVKKVAGYIRQIKDHLPEIATIIGGISLGKFLTNLAFANIRATTLLESIKLIGQKIGLLGGITLTVSGIVLETKGIIDSINNQLNTSNFAQILAGGGAITGGAALIGKTFGAAVIGAAGGAILAGIGAAFAGIYDAIVNGIDWLSATLIPIGTTAAGAGIGALIGSVGGPLGALVGVAVGALVDLTILIVQKWDTIAAWFKETFGKLGEWFKQLWGKISSGASACWDAIKNFFAPAIRWFSDLFSSIGQTFRDVFYNIGVLASGTWEVIKKAWGIAATWFNETIVTPVKNFFSGLWDSIVQKAAAAWQGIKNVFSTVGQFFSDTFRKAWQKVVEVFSPLGEVFVAIKDAIVSAFKTVVNGLISGINAVVAVPFNGINKAINKLKSISILGLTPFDGLRNIHVPQIPKLAQGAVLPANRPFLAMVGDQKHGTNVEAPLSTIQEAVAAVMAGNTSAMMAGFEASVGIQREILEAILGIQIGDDLIAAASERYSRKMAVVTGGAL